MNTKINKLKKSLLDMQPKIVKVTKTDYTLDNGDVSDTEELAADMMSLLASFSGKFYGKRSAERRKKNKIE